MAEGVATGFVHEGLTPPIGFARPAAGAFGVSVAAGAASSVTGVAIGSGCKMLGISGIVGFTMAAGTSVTGAESVLGAASGALASPRGLCPAGAMLSIVVARDGPSVAETGAVGASTGVAGVSAAGVTSGVISAGAGQAGATGAAGSPRGLCSAGVSTAAGFAAGVVAAGEIVASSVVVFAGPDAFAVAGSSRAEVIPLDGALASGDAPVVVAGALASGEAGAPPQRLAAGTTGSGLALFAASGAGVPQEDAGAASVAGFGASTGTPQEVAGAGAAAAAVSEPTADNPPSPDVSGAAGVLTGATIGVVSGVTDVAGTAAAGFLAKDGKTLCSQGVFSCVGAGATATVDCSGLSLLFIQYSDYSI